MGKKAKCMADGGIVKETPEQLMARMAAKYGTTGAAQAAPVQPVPQPQPIQQPAPQPQSSGQGIMGLLAGRGRQIDKAAGYARGGIVRGKGTPTSDDVPMNIAGNNVNLSNMEAVLPHKTVMALGGPKAVEALIAATNGRPPVRGGLKEGGEYNNGAVGLFDKDPLTAIGSAISDSMNSSNKAEDYNKSLYPSGTFDASNPAPTKSIAAPSNPVAAPASHVSAPSPSVQPGVVTADSQPNHSVSDTSQQGITKVARPGHNPLYTNINPDEAIAGLKSQTIGGDSASVNEGLARYQRANDIRQSMIDSQPQGGIAVMAEPTLPGGMSIADWNKNVGKVDYQAAMKSAGTRTERAAYGQMMNAAMNNETQQRGQDMAQQTANSRDVLTARGQDLNSASDMARIAGNPVDNAFKQAQTQGITAGIAGTKAMSDLQAKAIGGDQNALDQWNALNGKNQPSYKAIHAAGGQTLDGKNPDQVFVIDERTGQARSITGGQQAAQAPEFKSKDELQAAIKAGTIKSGKTVMTPNGPMVVK